MYSGPNARSVKDVERHNQKLREKRSRSASTVSTTNAPSAKRSHRRTPSPEVESLAGYGWASPISEFAALDDVSEEEGPRHEQGTVWDIVEGPHSELYGFQARAMTPSQAEIEQVAKSLESRTYS